MQRYHAWVEIDGLVGVYSIRAVWTALTAVPGIVSAEVTMNGTTLHTDGPIDEQALRDALATADVTLRSLKQEPWTLPGR